MTPREVADLLEHYAVEVTRLPGVSRRNPHAFAEAKSELAGLMRRRAVDLRSGPERPVQKPPSITPGDRIIGNRRVLVERRSGRAL